MSGSTYSATPRGILVLLLQPVCSVIAFFHSLWRYSKAYLRQAFRGISREETTPSATAMQEQHQETKRRHRRSSSITMAASAERNSSFWNSEFAVRLRKRILHWGEVLVEWLEWVGRVGIIGVLLACAPVGWAIQLFKSILRSVQWLISGVWWESFATRTGLVGVEELLGQVSKAISAKTRRPRKTLILDLDETLVHSKFKHDDRCDIRLEIKVDKFPTSFYVTKRPYLDVFLQTAAKWYNIVIFTASLKRYADPLINLLDPTGAFVNKRYFRESCEKYNGTFIKDVTMVEPNLSDVLIVDNSPAAYIKQAANAVPIEPWYDDADDEELLNLLPLLHAIAPLRDVRSLLALRLTGGVLAAKTGAAKK